MSNIQAATEAVFARIDGDELTDLAVSMGRIVAHIGREKPMADFLIDWLQQKEMPAQRLVASELRHNVIAKLTGSGGGRSLIINAHQDSDRSVEENQWITPYPERSIPTAWIEGDKVFGRAVLNDRGCMACFLIAGKAIQDAGVRLKGDLTLAMVVGETDQAPVDEFQGPEFEGNGYGTYSLLQRGVLADYAVVAETTDFSPVWLECGIGFVKITTYGHAVYTPRTSRPGNVAQSTNATVKMAHLVVALEEWCRQYEADNTRDYPLGRVVPKASINAIRGGLPYRVALSAGVCSIYVDVRILPGVTVQAVERQLRAFVDSQGLGAKVETYYARTGVIAENVDPLLDAVKAAHRTVIGGEPAQSLIEERSMWRDIIPYNEWKIPSLTYGPPRRVLTGEIDERRYSTSLDDGGKVKYFLRDDMIRAAKIYALIALQICGVE